MVVQNIISHDIDQSTYAKIGEILLRWAEAEGFLANSINWMSGISPESEQANSVYKLSMKEKLKRLERLATGARSAAENDINTLLRDIRQAMKWKRIERDAIAHGTALKTGNGTIVLRTDKGLEFGLDDMDDALMHAREMSNLAVRLNMLLAAPWTKDLPFSPQSQRQREPSSGR